MCGIACKGRMGVYVKQQCTAFALARSSRRCARIQALQLPKSWILASSRKVWSFSRHCEKGQGRDHGRRQTTLSWWHGLSVPNRKCETERGVSEPIRGSSSRYRRLKCGQTAKRCLSPAE